MKWRSNKELPGKGTIIIFKDGSFGVGDYDDCQHGCWDKHYDRSDNGNNLGACVDTIGNLRTCNAHGECPDIRCIDIADTQGWMYLHDIPKPE